VAARDASVSGISTSGTGKARSFRDLMLSAYAALGISEYRMSTCPNELGSYQYFTQSEVDRLQRAKGCQASPRWKMRSGLCRGFSHSADRFR
jgi:ADP-L-glycero-D-manno-heptose 6-epimerase